MKDLDSSKKRAGSRVSKSLSTALSTSSRAHGPILERTDGVGSDPGSSATTSVGLRPLTTTASPTPGGPGLVLTTRPPWNWAITSPRPVLCSTSATWALHVDFSETPLPSAAEIRVLRESDRALERAKPLPRPTGDDADTPKLKPSSAQILRAWPSSALTPLTSTQQPLPEGLATTQRSRTSPAPKLPVCRASGPLTGAQKPETWRGTRAKTPSLLNGFYTKNLE